MSDAERHLEHYVAAVRFAQISGFEVLEMLDVRSKLAECEDKLTEPQKVQLEEADRFFFRDAAELYASVAALGDLADMRQRAAAPRSHWWWYLDELVRAEKASVG